MYMKVIPFLSHVSYNRRVVVTSTGLCPLERGQDVRTGHISVPHNKHEVVRYSLDFVHVAQCFQNVYTFNVQRRTQ